MTGPGANLEVFSGIDISPEVRPTGHSTRHSTMLPPDAAHGAASEPVRARSTLC